MPTRRLTLDRTRRALAIFALALLALSALPRLEAPAYASTRASGRIVANEVRHSDPAARGSVERLGGGTPAQGVPAGQTGGETLSVTSQVVDAGQRYDHVGIRWRLAPGKQRSTFLELRWSGDGTTWSEWEMLTEDEDLTDEATNERYFAPYLVGDARYAQYRMWVTDGDLAAARSIGLTFMDVTDLHASPLTRLLNDVSGALDDLRASFAAHAAVNAVTVRTRADWRADEKLMEWWPQYVPWKKAVVHHTVTKNTYTDSAAEIRAIYYFHAVTRGWGDIGYNFIVDRFGQVWTGRQGGDDVVGGHAFGWNEGSMGVATLGDFSTVAPTSVMINGVAHVIAMKFIPRGIHPLGADTFTHKEEDASGAWQKITSNPPNIVGHRECSYIIGIQGAQTACPGQALYSQMQTLKTNVLQAYDAGYSYLPAYTTDLPHSGNVGQTIPVTVTVKNSGRATLSAGGASPSRLQYRVLNPSAGYSVIAQGPQVPLPMDLAPGASTLVNTSVLVPQTAGRYLVRWDLWTPAGWLSATSNAPVRDQWFSAVDWDVTWLSDNTPEALSAGQTTVVNVSLKNTGARPWPASSVRLSYHWVSDVTQRMVVWNGERALLPYDVLPGQPLTVPIAVKVPAYPTRYRIQYDLVWEGAFWFSAKGTDLWERTTNVTFDYKAAYQAPATLTMPPSASALVPVTITNTGTSTWPAGGDVVVDLGSHWRQSDGTLLVWDGLRTTLPSDLGPGASAQVQARLQSPSAVGTYQVQWDMSLEGVSWFSGKGVAPATTIVTVKPPTYGATYAPSAIGPVASGARTTVPVTITNTSDFTWTAPTFALAYHLFDSAGRLAVWDGARTQLPQPIDPGESVTLQAVLQMPAGNGMYKVTWDMVHEGVNWFSSKQVEMAPQVVSAGSLSYGALYDASLAPAAMSTSMPWNVLVKVTNRSNLIFSPASNVWLSYHWFDANGRVVVWDGARSPIQLNAGETASFWTTVYGPPQPGTYRLMFDLVHEGVSWFTSKGVTAPTRTVLVTVPQYGALYAAPATASGASGQTINVPVTVTNTGSLVWNAQVFLAYHVYRNGAVFVWDGPRTAISTTLAPGQSTVVQAQVRVPATPGAYDLRFDLVREGVTWFSAAGVPSSNVSLSAQ